MHRFFIEQKLQGEKEVLVTDPKLIHQWLNVFRYKWKSKLVLFDNSGFEFVVEVVSLQNDKAELQIIEERESSVSTKKDVSLFYAVVKNKINFEWVLEKGTELGVSNFYPIFTDRSEEKKINLDRSQAIIKESAEQSGRAKLPLIHETENLVTALEKKDLFLIAFHAGEGAISWNTFKDNQGLNDAKRIGIFIGPEGGWSEREVDLFKQNSIPLVSLGEATLRAETAAVVASALLLV